MRTTFYKIFSVLVVFIISNTLIAQIQPINSENAKKIVDQTMIPFLRTIPSNIVKFYGIKDSSEFKSASAGVPIPVYYLDHDSLIFSNTWRVPLIINQEFRALFTVYVENENYSIVDFGATLLAKEIQKYSNENPILGIFRVFSIQKDFFIIQNENLELNFDPIPWTPNQKCSLNAILETIKL